MTLPYLGLARFIGQNGSMGFTLGQIYDIRAYRRTDGLILLMARGRECPYRNERKMKENWELLNVKT